MPFVQLPQLFQRLDFYYRVPYFSFFVFNDYDSFLFFLGSFQSSNEKIIPISRSTKEVMYNPKYEELFAPDVGPHNPFKTEQQKASKNILSGYVETAHLNEFQFENQRRTFHSYGFAIDPSISDFQQNAAIVMSEDREPNDVTKTVFEKTSERILDKRKRFKNNNAEDIEGFLGPWGSYINEKKVVKPTEVSCPETSFNVAVLYLNFVINNFKII